MVGIEYDHLGGPAGGSAGLHRRGRTVGDLQKGEQPGGNAAAGEVFVGGPDFGEIGARARTVLEEPGFPGDEIHDAALVHQIVLDIQDEAGVGLGAGIGRTGFDHLVGKGVHVIMTLGGPLYAVDRVQARIEPLGAVGRGDLVGEHIEKFFIENLFVLGAVEITRLSSPKTPGIGQAVKNLPGIVLGSRPAAGSGKDGLRFWQVLRPGKFRLSADSGLSKVFLGDYVGGYLAPEGGNDHVVHMENDLPVGIAYLAGPALPLNSFVRSFAFRRKLSLKLHPCSSSPKTGGMRRFEIITYGYNL